MGIRPFVIGLIAYLAISNILIAATGNMHRGRHHPLWVDVMSWLFAVDLVTLAVLAVVAMRRGARALGVHNCTRAAERPLPWTTVLAHLSGLLLCVLVCTSSSSAASVSVSPIRGALTAADVPKGIYLISDQNGGLGVTAQGLHVTDAQLRRWRYRADYEASFLGTLHGAVVGIESSIVLFGSSAGARGSVAFTAQSCKASKAAGYLPEPNLAPQAYVCVQTRNFSSTSLTVYDCIWSVGTKREGVSVNVPPSMSRVLVTPLLLGLAAAQARRSG